MPADFPANPEENGLTIRPFTGMLSLPGSDFPALSEIISRSLAQIQASRTLAAPERRAGEEQEFEIAPGVKIVMCWIPPGEFLMGSPEDEVGRFDDETQHRVILTQGYWLGKYQLTQAQWEAVMGSNPSHFNGSNMPVENVSWDDISEHGGFVEKANRFSAAAGIFSLPTEAQWEYACRAGTTTALNNGGNLTSVTEPSSDLDEVAWHEQNSGNKTHTVGLKKSNGWGLHDMHGNVYEWCMDWYGGYADEPLVDPQGPDSGLVRVSRGGGWGYGGADYCRAANRGSGPPVGSRNVIGFRIARSSGPSRVRKCDDEEACVVDDGKLHSLPKPTGWIVP